MHKNAEGLDAKIARVKPVQHGWTSESEIYSGKVPLRPIQRIGLLLLEGVPFLGCIFIVAMAISTFKDAPPLAWCLILPLILLWAHIGLAAGRYAWAALTAPSQRDGEEPRHPRNQDQP